MIQARFATSAALVLLLGLGPLSQATLGDDSEPQADPCAAQRAAYDEVHLRAQASLTALELTRDYSRELDLAIIATRRSAYHDATVDVASLAAGWPLGKAVETALLGKAENTFTEKLIKAGFKSVDKTLLKDPRLNTIFDQMNAGVETLGGVQFDELKQSWKNMAKELWGEAASESVMGFYDVALLGYKSYKGTKKIDAMRALARSVDNHIIHLQTLHTQQIDVLEDARHALNLCLDRVAKRLPPDNDNQFWRTVQSYLAARRAAAKPAVKPAAPPTDLSVEAKGAIRGQDTVTGRGRCTGAGYAQGTSCYVNIPQDTTLTVTAKISGPLPPGWKWAIVWEPYGGSTTTDCPSDGTTCTASITVPPLGGIIHNHITSPGGWLDAAMYTVACKPGEPANGHPC